MRIWKTRTKILFCLFFSTECDGRFNRRVFVPSGILTESARLVSFICLYDAHYILASSSDAFLSILLFNVFCVLITCVQEFQVHNFLKILSQTILIIWTAMIRFEQTVVFITSGDLWIQFYKRKIETNLVVWVWV